MELTAASSIILLVFWYKKCIYLNSWLKCDVKKGKAAIAFEDQALFQICIVLEQNYDTGVLRPSNQTGVDNILIGEQLKH